MIVDNARNVNASAFQNYLKNFANSNGLWLAIGSGNQSWDQQIPTINSNTTKLVSEITRVPILSSDIQLVEKSNTNSEEDIIVNNSSVLRVLGNISNVVNTAIREYGLFINGSDQKDSGVLYSYGIHNKVVLGQLNLYMKYIYINF